MSNTLEYCVSSSAKTISLHLMYEKQAIGVFCVYPTFLEFNTIPHSLELGSNKELRNQVLLLEVKTSTFSLKEANQLTIELTGGDERVTKQFTIEKTLDGFSLTHINLHFTSKS